MPICGAALLWGCASIPVDERAAVREQVNKVADETIARMVAEDPTLRSALDEAIGHMAGQVSGTKGPIVGGGHGIALLYDAEIDTRTYVDINGFDFGAGLGAGQFRFLVIFTERQALERFREGTWTSSVGAVSAAGSQGTGIRMTSGSGYDIRIVSESGAVLSATARTVQTSVNQELTDTGISEWSVPNKGSRSMGQQGADAPRVWDHKLPFLGQKVVDKGYDLPLPYGLGLTYASVEQEQLLSSLQVGINGSEIRPFDFVAFDNAFSNSETVSLKADAWLFPFMNVFLMLGRVDGEAPMHVLLDGNTILEDLEIDCSGFPPNPLCPLLEDQIVTLPVEANFTGNTYGIGAVLAGGWKGWFVTIPFNWTYADMEGSQTDGASFTATPRVGHAFDLGTWGKLAVFVGGNYLDTDLTVDGVASTPGDELVFDFIIDQKNKDNWNALIGFNWDINRHFSWAAEYDGFTGSRDAIISSIVWRF